MSAATEQWTEGARVREPSPGDTLGGHYVIEAELGRGGFGVVFRGRHTEIEREVAIKVLLTTYARKDPTAVARFRREARIASSLHYPNTVQLFDYGETEQGVFYIVMELLDGDPLADILKGHGPLAVSRAVHICRQTLHSLMEAHAKAIVHRDIKPDNIMLVPLAYDQDFVKVMDFGIAKMVHDRAPSLTQAGLTLGTPRYMPVEQLKGAELTPATDLYSAGVVLYEMLTGKPAIEADSLIEVAAAVLDGAAIHLKPADGVPPILCEIVNKACAKEAGDRFQRARDFLEALDAWEPDVEVLPAEGLVAMDTRPPPGLVAAGIGQTRKMEGIDDADLAATLHLDAMGERPAAAMALQPTAPQSAQAPTGMLGATVRAPGLHRVERQPARTARLHGLPDPALELGPGAAMMASAPIDPTLLRVVLGAQLLTLLLMILLAAGVF